MYDVDKIVNENPLKEVISRYVHLKQDGREYRGLCPFHSEKTPSFTVVPDKGYYHCHGCKAHGSVIDFIKDIEKLSFREACDFLNGDDLPSGKQIEKREVKREVEDPYTALEPIGGEIDFVAGERTCKVYNPKRKKWAQFQPTDVYKYCDSEGHVIGYVLRLMVNGKKITPTIQMVRYKDKEFPCMYPFEKPRPVYKVEKLNAKGTVYIVEGEKSADALERVLGEGRVISWSMGTNNVDKTDWSQLPEGRNYILIPDADYKRDPDTGEIMPKENQIGYKAMKQVESLLPNPRKTYVVDTHCMGAEKDGWDVADTDFTEDSFEDWLNERMGRKKVDVEVQIKKRAEKVNYDQTHFKCLGFSGDSFYFYQNKTGQLHPFKAREISKSNMIMLAPLDYWECNYPKGKGGADWDAILDEYMRIQERVGVFDVDCIRGRGAWIDNGRSVLHLGNKVVVDGVEMGNDEIESEYVYMKGAPLALAYGSHLPCEESNKLVEACRLARWRKKSYGDLLAGWMFASLVCGVMPFRSHVYLTGESGSGKSWVMDNIVAMVMGRMPLMCSSKTSEAGIRKILNNDVRPVIFNETEAESQSDAKRLQGVFDLARAASDENAAPILKGSGDGESFICRSSFLFASINKSTSQHADENRTIFLELAGSPKNATQAQRNEDNDNFKKLERACASLINSEFVGSLLTRAVNLVPVMRKNHQTFADVGARVTGSRRIGSSMAMPLCGLYSLMNEDVISEDDAVEFIKKYTVEADKTEVVETQEEECLDKLKFAEIQVEDEDGFKKSILVAELVAMLASSNLKIEGYNRHKLTAAMKARGVMLQGGYLWLADKKDLLPAKCYAGTQYATNWKESTRRLEGVLPFDKQHFCPTLTASGIKVPLELFVHVNKDLFDHKVM